MQSLTAAAKWSTMLRRVVLARSIMRSMVRLGVSKSGYELLHTSSVSAARAQLLDRARFGNLRLTTLTHPSLA
jgi:hypothetical protein